MDAKTSAEKEIFYAALAVTDAARRMALLDSLCQNDPALRGRIEELLLAHGGTELQPPAWPVFDLSVSGPDVTPGETIGRYKLLEKIGEGGFGVVFMAEQKEPIRRKVALKIIKPGMDTKEVIGRFEAERQALAMMDHPNIAKVLDAGATDSGRPYFVMELVRGTPIVEFCDENNLSMQERLELFIPVCRAIQHAHQKAIIHRDIKPSNVLVTMHDDKSVVKVIDFGIAKALNTELTTRTVFTHFQQMIGTPTYMSPEQAQMSGLDVDTRADIYSLGVLLYELLTATTPIDSKELLRGGYDDICRRIREQEPPRPSNRVSTMDGVTRSAAAKSRKTDADRLGGLMRGDLDWIVMKALEKDRTRRYQTANDFADDVRRHLSREPVLACPPTLRYCAAKFVRKYKRQVGVAAAFLIVLCLSSILAWGLYLDARTARDAARTSEQEAEGLADDLQRQLSTASLRLLPAQSQGLQLDAPVTSVLIAAEAVKASRGYDNETQAQAFESLASSLGKLGGESLVQASVAVSCTAVDPEGTWIASGHSDGSISICPMAKGTGLTPQTIPHAHHDATVRAIVLSKGRVFSVAFDGFARCWDLAANGSPELVSEIPCKGNSLAVSPDGRWLAARTSVTAIGIWDLSKETEEPVRAFDGRQNVYDWRFTSDGKQLIAKEGHDDGPPTIRVWDFESGREVKVLQGHEGWITQVVVSNDSRWVATCGYDGTVRLWDLSQSETKDVPGLTLVNAYDAFEALAISPDNRWLAAGCDDDFVRVWDLNAPDPISSLQILEGHSGAIYAMAFTSDSQRLISGGDDKTARVWGMYEDGGFHCLAVLRGHEASVKFMEVDPRFQRVVTGSTDGTLRRWNLTRQDIAGTYPEAPVSSTSNYYPRSAVRVRFSKDDRWLASADLGSGIRIWPTDALGSEPRELLGHTQGVNTLAFGPLGRYLYSGSHDRTVRRWDLAAEGKQGVRLIELEEGTQVSSIAMNAKGDYLFLAETRDGRISMWRLESDKATFVDDIHNVPWPQRLAVHPDGRRLYAAQAPNGLVEWRTTPNSIERTRVIDRIVGGISAIALSEQGSLLAAGSSSGTVHLYQISDGEVTRLREVAGGSGIASLAFSADEKWLYAGGNRVLQGWRLDQPNDGPVLRMRGHYFKSIDVSRDGTRLVSGGENEEVPLVWRLKADDLLQLARQKAGRELTDEELRRFNIALSVP